MNAREMAVREALRALADRDASGLTECGYIVDGLLWDVPSGERWAAWITIRDSRDRLVGYRRRTRNIPRNVEYDDLLVHQYEAALDHAVGLICPAVTR